MIQNILIKLAAIAGGIIAIFTIGNLFGKKSQEINQLEESFEDTIKSTKRQENRRNDDISIVKRRMQKYIRK